MAAMQSQNAGKPQVYDAPEVVDASKYTPYNPPPPIPLKIDVPPYQAPYQVTHPAPYRGPSNGFAPSSSGGSSVEKALPKRTAFGMSLISLLFVIIGFLSVATIALAVVAGVEFSRANTASMALANATASNSNSSLGSSNSTYSTGNNNSGTSAVVNATATDSGCSTDPGSINGSIYSALNSGLFQRFCNLDSGGNDLLDVISPSFEACIETCAIWNVRRSVNGGSVQSCTGVAFVPSWYNTTGKAADAPAVGDCFLKRNITVAKLGAPTALLIVHVAVFLQ